MAEAAVRIDGATGLEIRLEHVPTPRGLIYAWMARPAGARSCVLVCSSLFGDFTANYHRERLLGLALAAQGHGVVRFHYVGEGNSEGERRDMTFASLCEDASTLLGHAATLGFSEFAVLGTRLGGLVAAATVASKPSVPLVLWEPVADPTVFLKSAQRAKRMSQAAQSGVPVAADWRQELENEGRLDLLGYDVYRPLIDTIMPVDLVATLGSEPRRVFIGRFGGKSTEMDPLAAELQKRGFEVGWGRYDFSESWWFQSELVPESGDLISATAAWLARALEESK
jgi:hypothetical protein